MLFEINNAELLKFKSDATAALWHTFDELQGPDVTSVLFTEGNLNSLRASGVLLYDFDHPEGQRFSYVEFMKHGIDFYFKRYSKLSFANENELLEHVQNKFNLVH